MSSSILKWMGMSGSSSKASNIQTPNLSDLEGSEKLFGFENFGNTCYCNSVLQALYFCKPFRECVQNYPYLTLLSELAPSSFGLKPVESSGILQSIASSQPSASTQDESSPSSQSKPNSKDSSKSPMTRSNSSPALLRKRTTSSSFIPSFSSSAKTSPTMSRKNTSDSAASTSASAAKSPGSTTPPVVLPNPEDDSLLTSLKDLFIKITSQKKRTGVIGPTGFVQKVKRENILFRSTQQQDAHEFLNFILNSLAETLQKLKQSQPNPLSPSSPPSHPSASQTQPETSSSSNTPLKTWIHELFEGELTNETRCLTCETVTKKSESFLDLSIDIEPNSSVSSCLRNFSKSEVLCWKNKFWCDNCAGLQEAEKMMKIRKLPPILALHLKRFKYQERLQKYVKLMYRVVFPFELKLFNTSDDAENPDREYQLFAIVVHIGSNPNHGHYIAIIRVGDYWLQFDDDSVELITEADITKYYGDSSPSSPANGYILFYQARDIGVTSLSKRWQSPLSPVGSSSNLGYFGRHPEGTVNGTDKENEKENVKQKKNEGGPDGKKKKDEDKASSKNWGMESINVNGVGMVESEV